MKQQEDISLADALTRVCEELTSKAPFQTHRGQHPLTPNDIAFFCDAGLGGLARWLRAAGYRAAWEPRIADEVLLRKARETGATILTTDSMLMERRLLRDSVIAALWLPPSFGSLEQLKKVFCEFGLSVGSPRCMSCGGNLARADKEELRERIPPRTYRWLNDYFVCAKCGKLFWHGTHWLRIQEKLRALESACLVQTQGNRKE